MTISRLDFKVSEVAIALGAGCKEQELIGDMLVEGWPRPLIDKVINGARLMLKDIEHETEMEESSLRIQKMIQEALDTGPL